MSAPSASRAPTTAGIHWVCPLDRISTLPTTRLSSALGAVGWAPAGAGTATRKRPPAKDAIRNWNERPLGELPIFSPPRVPGLILAHAQTSKVRSEERRVG